MIACNNSAPHHVRPSDSFEDRQWEAMSAAELWTVARRDVAHAVNVIVAELADVADWPEARADARMRRLMLETLRANRQLAEALRDV